MQRNRVLAGFLVVLAGGALAVGWRGLSEPPAPTLGTEEIRNLLIVVMDTQRADALGVYGHPKATSANLDEFAHSAVVFDNAYSAGTYTVPSFLAYMSSVHVRTHGWDYSFDERFPKPGFCSRPDLTTLAQVLAQHGFQNHALSANGLLHPKRGFPRGFSTWNTLDVPSLANRNLTKSEAQLSDRDVMAKGLATIKSWDPSQRNFLYLHLMSPHLPLLPSRKARAAMSLPDTPKKILTSEIKELRKISTEEQREQTRLFYEAEVWDGDQQIGRILDTLDDHGHHDDTIVVVMSDHGEEIWEHGDYGHVDGVWEVLSHVPLLVRVPGVSPRRLGHPVSLIDVAPTVASALGISEHPDSWQGTDLFTERRPAVVTKRLGETAVTLPGGARAILNADGEWTLFDVTSHPEEAVPLEDPRRLEEAIEQYEAFLERVPPGAIDRDAPLVGICGVVKGQEEADHVEELRALGYMD